MKTFLSAVGLTAFIISVALFVAGNVNDNVVPRFLHLFGG